MTTADVQPSMTRAVRRRARRLVAAALLAGLALRLAFAFGYWVGKPLTLDEREYLLLAGSLARGQGFTYPDAGGPHPARHFERPPVFAAFLVAVLGVSGHELLTAPLGDDGVPRGFPRSSSDIPASIKIAQSLVGAMVILLVASLAARAAGAAGAVVGALLAAVYPPMAWSSGYVLNEPLYSALALGVVVLLHGTTPDTPEGAGSSATSRARSRWAALAAGVVAGVAVLTKEHLVFFLPLAALWLLWRRSLVHLLLVMLGVGLVLGPWVSRNYAVHGRFVLTASHGGVTFWTGNNALAHGEGDLAANPEMGRARVAFEERRAGATPQELDSAYYQDAARFIAEHPGRWALLLVKKLFYTFVPIGPSYRLHSRLYFLATLFSYAFVLALAVPGFVALVAAGRGGRLAALWLLALSAIIVCVVFFPQERFRIPVLDPTLVVCAAVWLASRPPIAGLFPFPVPGRV